jgi:apolipoprotein N-acyltransferase
MQSNTFQHKRLLPYLLAFIHDERRLLLWVATSVLMTVYLTGIADLCGDVAVVCFVSLMVRWNERVLVVTSLGIFLTYAAYPPLRLPTYFFSLAGVLQTWRLANQCAVAYSEGFAFGCAVAWWSIPHIGMAHHYNGEIVRLSAVAIIGCQFACLAATSYVTRKLPRVIGAVIVALVGTALEFVRVYEIEFPLLLLSQPAASTPIAQWASVISVYGVSAILYLINALVLPLNGNAEGRYKKWLAPSLRLIGTGVVLVGFWLSGMVLMQSVQEDCLPLDIITVQPRASILHSLGTEKRKFYPMLQHWTAAALNGRDALGWPKPELIVWPDFTIDSDPENSPAKLCMAGQWAGAILFGMIPKRPDGLKTKSAILAGHDGSTQQYDALKMIPFSETMPSWLKGNSWGKFFGMIFGKGPFEPGSSYRLMSMECAGRPEVTIGVAIYRESHFPHLLQYHCGYQSDVIVHLLNEDKFAETYPEMAWYATWDVQYRAIETRSWQVICSCSANSAIIDRRGKVRLLLGPGPGTIDSGPISLKRPAK